MIGLLIGWSWRPRWTGLVYLGLRFLCTVPPGFGARRVWLAFTALSVCRTLWSRLGSSDKKSEESGETEAISRVSDTEDTEKEQDLEHLLHLLEAENANMEWQSMMDKSTPNVSYQAWRHEPQVLLCIVVGLFLRTQLQKLLGISSGTMSFDLNGILCLLTSKLWKKILIQEQLLFTGLKRRIWESEKKYYAVTKGVPYPALPKRDKPRRVEIYFSSWIIKAVESRKGDGQLSACEVSLVHCEDMGIPKDVAKLGVRHGMWGAVKKLNSGLRSYQTARKAGAALSLSAQIARITTKLNMDVAETSRVDEEERGRDMEKARRRKDQFSVDWKLIVVGGVALACGLHSSAIGKALMFGAAQRLAHELSCLCTSSDLV
ncbi:uncharacterized protein LOC106367510 isoform X1 [Brassica napus]|uniref:uncharacterized protein LOC106295096 isoform X1 n=1 Tax=Brassica oleracea var. oleracea TaxID=109376 RepID=UPI0006A703F5|nr:PREDICTED: uncharacterized protein LOC106295096 isoform X1 [Brassica oleracea var. oleracea]XP_048612547.1 uncharacterized protein LOC106367510 isoform X1 [Brassica napus]